MTGPLFLECIFHNSMAKDGSGDKIYFTTTSPEIALCLLGISHLNSLELQSNVMPKNNYIDGAIEFAIVIVPSLVDILIPS